MVSTRRRENTAAAPGEKAVQDPVQDELQTAADAAEPVADSVADVENQVCNLRLRGLALVYTA